MPILLPRPACSQQLRLGWAAILTLVFVFVAAACATQEPLPTYTPLPTHTPYPTPAALPTHTPFPTWTPTPTNTPAPTANSHTCAFTRTYTDAKTLENLPAQSGQGRFQSLHQWWAQLCR